LQPREQPSWQADHHGAIPNRDRQFRGPGLPAQWTLWPDDAFGQSVGVSTEVAVIVEGAFPYLDTTSPDGPARISRSIK
jgi:hypothetical protein